MNYLRISIIVPVYNAGEYVSETIESVLRQTVNCWELILVNDGSQDNSLDIINEYVARDNRITYINQDNGGVSSARRNGLLQATGDYVTFLDADDILVDDAVEYVVKFVNTCKVDLLSGSIQRGLEHGARIEKLKDKNYNKKEYAKAHSYNQIKCGLHADFFKRSVLLANDVLIDRRIVNNEDYLYKLFSMQSFETIVTTSKVLHRYRIREGSVCHRPYPIDYWYTYFDYLSDNYRRFNVSENNYLIAKLTKITSLVRSMNLDFDRNHPSVSDLKGIRFYDVNKLTFWFMLLYIHTGWVWILRLLRIHPFHMRLK